MRLVAFYLLLRRLTLLRAIRKFSIFFPFFNASTSHLGLAPLPAQVSPDGLRYFAGTFLPLSGLPSPSPPPLPDSLQRSFRNSAALLLTVLSISARSFKRASTGIEARLGLDICCLQASQFHCSSFAVSLNPKRARPPATIRPIQLSHFGTDQSPIMIAQSSKIRTRWNRATKVKIIPANRANVLRFMSDHSKFSRGLQVARKVGVSSRALGHQPPLRSRS